MADTESDAYYALRVTILISGNGSNLQAIIDAAAGEFPTLPGTSIVRVISNKKSAYGLTRAESAGIPTAYHNLISGGYTKRFPNPDPSSKAATAEARASYDADLATLVLADKPDLVVCAGWMHVLSPPFLQPLEQSRVPIINLHPALPGQYNGANAIQRAYDDFKQGKVNHSGCMIHYVIQEVDMGAVITELPVAFQHGETLDHYETRMHEAEHVLIVRGTRTAMDTIRGSRQAAAS